MKTRELILAIAELDEVKRSDKLEAIKFIASDAAKGPWKLKTVTVPCWGWKHDDTAGKSINHAFPWDETPQGHGFWLAIREALSKAGK